MRRLIALAALALAACGEGCSLPEAAEDGSYPKPRASASMAAPGPNGARAPVPATRAPAGDGMLWGDLVKPDDIARYERLDEAWRAALAEARTRHAAELAALGPLADPQAGLPRPHPAPGLYHCRVVKLGSRTDSEGRSSGVGLVAYSDFRCRVDLTPGGDLRLAKLTGSQRTTGQLYPERDAGGEDTDRLVYLGSQAWGSDEPSAPGYGRRLERDQIGVLERIGPDRYRLALPWPRQESKLDLIELVRVGN